MLKFYGILNYTVLFDNYPDFSDKCANFFDIKPRYLVHVSKKKRERERESRRRTHKNRSEPALR